MVDNQLEGNRIDCNENIDANILPKEEIGKISDDYYGKRPFHSSYIPRILLNEESRKCFINSKISHKSGALNSISLYK